MMRTHLLVIGAPRSGTTLLASMLGCHPDVSMLIEQKGFELAISLMVGTPVVANKLTIPNQVELTSRGRIRHWLLHQAGISRTELPSFFSIRDYLALENAKVIGIVRDPRDVVSSIIERGKQTPQEALRRWSRAIEILHQLAVVEQAPIQVVSFDRLVTNPRREMIRCAQFLCLPFDDRMLEGPKHNLFYPSAQGMDESKARRARPDRMRDNLPSVPPETHSQYNLLLELAQVSPSGGKDAKE